MNTHTKSTRKWWILVAALGLGGAVGCGEEVAEEGPPPLRTVRYLEVSGNAAGQARTFSGVVRAGTESRLGFQVPGQVTEVLVDVGDTIEANQRIAELDPTDYELQLQEARAQAAQARAQARSAAATYERVRRLYETNNSSRQALDEARTGRDVARSAVAAATQGIRRLQRQLEYATLRAPDGGRVSEVSVEAGAVVGAGQVVAVVQVGEQLEVALDVPEAVINQVERGQEVAVQIAANETEVNGTVHEIGVPRQGTTLFPVTVRLDAAEGVRAGMAAEVTFALEDAPEPRRFVPASAVGEDREGRFVWVVERGGEGRGTVHRRSVEVGAFEAEGIELEEGVEDGELVVTAGVSRISEGLEVLVPAPAGEAAAE